MSQFRSFQAKDKNPPGNQRAKPISAISAADAHVAHTVAAEPMTTPLRVVSPKPARGMLLRPGLRNSPAPLGPVGGFGREPMSDCLPPASYGQGGPASYGQGGPVSYGQGGPVSYGPPGVRNLPVPIPTGRSNQRYLAISLPVSHAPNTIGYRKGLQHLPAAKVPFVIPGSRRKRLPDTEELDFKTKHLKPSLRHGLVILATVGTFFLMMLTLTPIGSGNGSLLTGLIQETTGVPSKDITIIARNQAGTSGPVDGINDPSNDLKSKYVALARIDALKYGISPDLYVNQIQQESHFDPNAISYVGAIGIAQFMPGTAAEMNIDPGDPVQALDGGAHLMGDLNNRFNRNYAKALAAYNAGPGAVDIAVNSCGAAWLSCVDPQAQAYVYIIMG